jgi:hypothetical protein
LSYRCLTERLYISKSDRPYQEWPVAIWVSGAALQVGEDHGGVDRELLDHLLEVLDGQCTSAYCLRIAGLVGPRRAVGRAPSCDAQPGTVSEVDRLVSAKKA